HSDHDFRNVMPHHRLLMLAISIPTNPHPSSSFRLDFPPCSLTALVRHGTNFTPPNDIHVSTDPCHPSLPSSSSKRTKRKAKEAVWFGIDARRNRRKDLAGQLYH